MRDAQAIVRPTFPDGTADPESRRTTQLAHRPGAAVHPAGQREKWSAARIAGALGVNEATVRRFRRRYWEYPGLILELDLYEMVSRAKDEEFLCLVCEEWVLTQREVQRHVLRHFVDQPVVDAFIPKGRKRSARRT